jgi:hypothetical protein
MANESLSRMDALIHRRLAVAGLAEEPTDAQYTQPDKETPGGYSATSTPCRIYVDKDTQTVGEVKQFKAGRVEVVYFLEDCDPRQHGKVVVSGETFVNVDKIKDDGSLSRWLVRRG